jgi:hypothetical protein
VFPPDNSALAIFELNGSGVDSSGHGRHASLIGAATFTTTAWGKGLVLQGDPGSLNWSSYAGLIQHPYTIEVVVVPSRTSCYAKLFSFSDSNDRGWYYCGQFNSYPHGSIGPQLLTNQRHYFAMVSTGAGSIQVYLNGSSIGAINASFSAPPGQAIFFRDDSVSGRSETLTGVVEAVRISNVSRSTNEIKAIQSKLNTSSSLP